MNDLSAQLAESLPVNNGDRPGWLAALRNKGAEQFRRYGLPNKKDEAWKYTGLNLLKQTGLQLDSGIETSNSDGLKPEPLVKTGIQISMFDGQFRGLSGELPLGLTVLPLAGAINQGVDGLQELLESLSATQSNKGSSDGFMALNSATLEAGLVIHVAAGTDAGRLSVSWCTDASEKSRLFNSRICVIVGQEAKLELLEHFESAAENRNSSNVVLQAGVDKDASFQHIRFQQESENAVVITRTEVSQQSGSEYTYYGFDLGGGLVRHDLHSVLLGRGATATLNGAYLLDGNRHVDNHARVDHIAQGCFSDQYFRGVAGGNGRAVFNTAVCVHPGADDSEAKQSNANILLSRRAVINTKPELEIYADEVIASHGATVGQLDEEAIFYMQSRGLSEAEARQLLTTAFCRSVSNKLTDPVLSEVISERMMAVMPQTEQ